MTQPIFMTAADLMESEVWELVELVQIAPYPGNCFVQRWYCPWGRCDGREVTVEVKQDKRLAPPKSALCPLCHGEMEFAGYHKVRHKKIKKRKAKG